MLLVAQSQPTGSCVKSSSVAHLLVCVAPAALHYAGTCTSPIGLRTFAQLTAASESSPLRTKRSILLVELVRRTVVWISDYHEEILAGMPYQVHDRYR